MKVRYVAPARQELREAIRYYELQLPGLGRAFRDEVYGTVERIKRLPTAWQSLGDGARRCQTRRFPYGIIYAQVDGELVILAIAHLHREPDYWRDR